MYDTVMGFIYGFLSAAFLFALVLGWIDMHQRSKRETLRRYLRDNPLLSEATRREIEDAI